jgi:hypothetical protein
MLRVDLTAPRKQRHTIRRIVARLLDEHGIEELPYSTVRDYVGPRRREIAAEAGRGCEQGFILQTHEPGHFPIVVGRPVPLKSKLTGRACSLRGVRGWLACRRGQTLPLR